MKALKIVGIAIGAVIALAVLVVGGTWFGTSAPRAQAAAILAAARADDAAALGPLLHPAIQTKVSPEKMLHMLRGWGLHEPGELSWRRWEIGTEGAHLEGAIGRADGWSQPLKVVFRRHDGDWKLISIDTELRDLVRDPLALQVPPSDELVEMLARVTRDFGAGVREGSLTALYASMARNARAKFTQQEVDAAFAQFIEGEVKVDHAADLVPQLRAPAIVDPAGTLKVSGHYPSRPVLTFSYSFVFEEGEWRLVDLTLDSGVQATE